MITYGCIICGSIVTEKNTMCSDCKEAYKKGVRDMFEGFKTECSSRIGIWINTPEGRIAGCDWVPSKMHETKCCIDNCPIAEKLLKAVK